MKNNSESNAPLNDADFKKAWEALEDEYELELQQLHAEIERENKNNSAEIANITKVQRYDKNE